MSFTVMDLFAGAGGFSLGFEQEDFNVVLALEKDAWATETYKYNHKNKNIIEADILDLPNTFFKQFADDVDIVIGGPPCQGFSIAASNRRKINDERNFLYREFLRAVEIVSPKIVIMENVKEIIKYCLEDGTKIIDDINNRLHCLGYISDYVIINCRNYGIPQDRKRFFLFAVKQKIIMDKEKLDIERMFKDYIQPELNMGDAITDLPIVKPRQYTEDTILQYSQPPQNEYQKRLRSTSINIYNHIPMRHTDKTIEKFKYILKNNFQELPISLKPLARGSTTKVSTSNYEQNHRVLNFSKVSPTITASFYSSFIHPNQPRNITVREAARIQSFPDWFVFKGKKTTLSKKLLAKKGIFEELHLDQFNQVGNAVPPIIAQYFAKISRKILEGRISVN